MTLGVINSRDLVVDLNQSPFINPNAPLPEATGILTPTPCYPQNFIGPLPPGTYYCEDDGGGGTADGGGGTGGGNTHSCPAGATCTFINGVPNTAIYAMVGIVGAFLFMGIVKK